MKVGLVALHYPRPEHWDEMISRVHRAAEGMAATRPARSSHSPPHERPHEETTASVREDHQKDVPAGEDKDRPPGLISLRSPQWYPQILIFSLSRTVQCAA
jgi:hypothetical protein